IGLVGVSAPMANTNCGRAATGLMWGLTKGGLHLEDEPGLTFDERGRRLYHATTRDGRLLAEELTKAGVARAEGRGIHQATVAAGQSEASQVSRGCLWQAGQGASIDNQAPVMRTALASINAAPLAATLPSGFAEDIVAGGLTEPTAFTFLPDGRILIAEKAGLVKVVKNGTLLSTPFIDIRSRVNAYWDHGLLGIAADPNFATNGYVYLLFTYENDPAQFSSTKTGRLARYTASGDTASVGSETVILGTQVGTSCNNFAAGADCIPSDSPSHSVGNIKFAADQTMYVTTGDGAHFNYVDDNALRSQNLDLLSGKLLHITRTGQGISTNPFWNNNANANRSKVWAYGLRNSYRFNLRPSNGVPYIGDVGWNSWEEVNVATRGANLGWPCYEGDSRQGGYEPKAVCQTLYAQGPSGFKLPLYQWNHSQGSAASTGGMFYTGTSYPTQYQGAYFFGDYAQSWLNSLRVDAIDNLVAGSVTAFGTSANGPVDIEMGPDGNLYYLAINTGELTRVRYTIGNTPPIANATANPSSGLAPLSVQFSSAGTSDPDGDAITTSWDFGDGTAASTQANPQHTYSANGTYTARLTVADTRGGSVSDTVAITVGNRAPTVTITAPTSSLRYKVGDVISFAGSATDPDDGPLPSSALSWQITIQHCPGGACHTHQLQTATGSTGTFTVPDHGDDSFFELSLTARDSSGLTSSATTAIQPQTIQISVATSPAGLLVVYDGTTATAPLTRTTVVGSTHTINTPAPQYGATFSAWSDSGAQQHNVTVGAANVSYVATFTGGTPQTVTFDDRAGQDQVLNGEYPTGVINWGTNLWWHSAPWLQFTTKSIGFNGPGATSANFSFLYPRRLVSVRAFNGGPGASTVSLSCAGQTTRTQSVAVGQVITIATNWTGTCTSVGVGSTNGWDTNFDDLVWDLGGPPPPPDTTPPQLSAIASAPPTDSGTTVTWTTDEPADSQVDYGTTASYGASTTLDTNRVTSHSVALSGLQASTLYHYRVRSRDGSGNLATSGDFTFTTAAASATAIVTFDDRPGQNQVLTGQYPTGVIDWGTSGAWYHSAPWGGFTTKNMGFSGPSVSSATFTFITPRRLVSLRAFNGGPGPSTVTVACPGQTTRTQTVNSGQLVTITTNWTAACTTVTLSSSNSWDTNFDDLVHGP
ncbi:MAG TPA: PQQ-dependent sugar dehydrogenase, partial [Chloroflexota bacterium]